LPKGQLAHVSVFGSLKDMVAETLTALAMAPIAEGEPPTTDIFVPVCIFFERRRPLRLLLSAIKSGRPRTLLESPALLVRIETQLGKQSAIGRSRAPSELHVYGCRHEMRKAAEEATSIL
jgi:hypothetical protein